MTRINDFKSYKERRNMKSIMISLVFSAIFATTSTQVLAETGIYTDIDVMYNQVKVNNGKFNPWSGKIKLGYNITKNWAVEGQYGTSFKDDTDQGVTLELKQVMGAYVRWGSDMHNNVRLYILLGQGRSVVEYTGSEKHEDTLDGFSWAIGAEERSSTFKTMSYTVEYTSYYHKSGQDVSGLSLGLRFDF